jgi:3-hydroxybutyryl-CoA dehydratase
MSPRGYYFDQFHVGEKYVSPGRTVTESDIVAFAGLSGDYNQIHVDEEYSKSTPYGQRIAHGLLGLSIASGLAVQTGIMEGTIVAFREISEWKFVKPIHISDTIHVEMEVLETKEMSRLKVGALTIGLKVINQKEDLVMKGSWLVLIAIRPS